MHAFVAIVALCGAGAEEIPAGGEPITIAVKGTTVKIAPAAGANAYSLVHEGREYLRQPKNLKDLPGVAYGSPVLYPMPNRVRDGKFAFEGKTYAFKPNNGANFIHGLVHSAPWELLGRTMGRDSETAHLRLVFKPGTPWHDGFPFPHVLKLDIRVAEGSVRWTYTVDNSAGDRPVPFGFALHPYFPYQGAREKTLLTVPAETRMEARDGLPSGKLLPVAGTPFDFRSPQPLSGKFLDDVFFGLKPEAPAKVEFLEIKRRLVFAASADFGHLVVWTPKDA
ncbi:MAG TPA: aldose 1-epimerase, partial [Planctomycetia bacterium]|nr:aldose 1-epimerase [Planctomycetia bacterium]